MVATKTLETLHNVDAILNALERAIEALPPQKAGPYEEWLRRLDVDYRTWRNAVARGRRSLADVEAESRVGIALQRVCPKGWVQMQ
jgi:hypothetical protein